MFIYARQQRASARQRPMAAVRGIDDLLPTVALAVALATLEEIQRRDGLEDEMEEIAPRVKLTRCWGMKTSLTPQALRLSSFEPTSACSTLLSWSY